MANPTSNFNWQMPTSSDLVTDLPADFEVFGQAVDTSLADLKGGTTGQVLSKASNTDMDFTWVAQDDSNAIQNAIVDAKGDLIGATAADTPARLAVGTNGQVLTADSTAATGLAWTTPAAGGGYTALATTTLNNTATTYTYSSLGSYKHIVIVGNGLQSAVGSAVDIGVQFNGDTGSNYNWSNSGNDAGTALAQSFLGQPRMLIRRALGLTGDASSRFGSFIATIPLYGSSQYKQFQCMSFSYQGGSGYGINNLGYWNSTAAITSITLFDTTTSNFKAGTITVYGVN